MPRVYRFYDNESIFVVIEAQDATIEVYRRGSESLVWEDITDLAVKDGFYVRDSEGQPSYFKIDEGKLLRAYYHTNGRPLFTMGQQLLQRKNHEDRTKIESIEKRFQPFSRTDEVVPTLLSEETILTEIQDFKQRQEFAKKERILTLADIKSEDAFSMIIKNRIMLQLAPLGSSEPKEIAAFIQALMRNINYSIAEDDIISIDCRNRWLFNYDFIAKELMNFPDKTVADYHHQVEEYLRLILAQLLSMSRDVTTHDVHIQTSPIHGEKNAYQYWMSKLFAHSCQADEIAAERDLFLVDLMSPNSQCHLDLRQIFKNFDKLQKIHFLKYLAERFSCNYKSLFDDYRSYWQMLDLDLLEDPQTMLEFEEVDAEDATVSPETLKTKVLFNSFIQFQQDYLKTPCPKYLFRWIWAVCDFVYRMCAWMDTYCLGIGQANHLYKNIIQADVSHAFFKKELNMGDGVDFSKELSQKFRDVIWGNDSPSSEVSRDV